MYRIAFPGLHVSLVEVTTVGDTVVLQWTARTVLAKLVDGIVARESRSLKGITRSRIGDGKIAESWTDWDRIGLLRKLGIPTE